MVHLRLGSFFGITSLSSREEEKDIEHPEEGGQEANNEVTALGQITS